MSTTPLSDGQPAGRHPLTGQFAMGNKLGRGNPHARAVNRLRSALLRAVKSRDVQDVAKALLDKAREGDTAAARILLDYTIGRPVATADTGCGQAPVVKVIAGIDLDRVLGVEAAGRLGA